MTNKFRFSKYGEEMFRIADLFKQVETLLEEAKFDVPDAEYNLMRSNLQMIRFAVQNTVYTRILGHYDPDQWDGR